MNKSGIGAGSVSIILVFTVLCLTIFALITYMSANADVTLAEASAQMVIKYYEADTLAEQILAEIIASDEIPKTVHGVDIHDGLTHITYACPVSDTQALYVDVAINFNSYDILNWTVRNIDENNWEADEGLPVWEGF